MSCGFTVTTTTAAPWMASAFDVVASTPYRSCSSPTRASLRAVTTMSVQPELTRPERSASPMRPVPRIAIRLTAKRLRGAPGGERQKPACVAGEHVHAREALPLPVGLEQLRGLPELDLAPAQLAQELDEAEIADEPVVVPAESLEADDADRPGPEAALPVEPGCDDRRRDLVQPLQLDRAAEADERGAAAGVQSGCAELRRRGGRKNLWGRGPLAGLPGRQAGA